MNSNYDYDFFNLVSRARCILFAISCAQDVLQYFFLELSRESVKYELHVGFAHFLMRLYGFILKKISAYIASFSDLSLQFGVSIPSTKVSSGLRLSVALLIVSMRTARASLKKSSSEYSPENTSSIFRSRSNITLLSESNFTILYVFNSFFVKIQRKHAEIRRQNCGYPGLWRSRIYRFPHQQTIKS